ncbi:AAA family ATPase [Pseudomonas sp. J452]|uniref:AAA family ATPase n=1 Tax=Pseudomonas sp. J452 TaxID=2898441 RepID=UPI0021ADC99C|nr:AAA family ATPase [Pseudomonas sp. J452]UUY07706.1 AAA family ATPase [Pseudomonas sp. J452]
MNLEEPALLDPCRDNPDEHLRFLDDGRVVGLTVRGDETIGLLDLNRAQLVVSRAEQVKLFGIAPDHERASKALGHTAHCAVWRQMLVRLGRPDANRANWRAAPARAEKIIDTELGIGFDEYRAKSQYISRVKIKNFGPINVLDLDLSLSESPQAPSFALLGENGVGKSTVLRALALALSGKAYAKKLKLSSSKLLSEGALYGEVRISIVGGEDDIIMKLHRNKPIEFNVSHSRSLVLAYGATRLLPRGRHKPKAGEAHAKIDNLFDPFLPLSDPAEWLSTLEVDRLEEVNSVLASLMPQEHQLSVRRDPETGAVTLQVGSVAGRKFSHLSDGYQSMLGMAVDIMRILYWSGSTLESAEGVVIIDELGNHFHPAWRLQCLSALRKAFPRVQFLYSTHDPLCLRGLYSGEVAVLRRDKLGHIYALEDLPSVSRLRVEQLLSSEHFGLRSTADPQMEDEIREYESLVETPDRTEDEETRLTELVQRLTDDRYLGATRRERLALQLLDSSGIDDIPAQPSVSARAMSDRTVSRLRYVMDQVSPRPAIGNVGRHDQD